MKLEITRELKNPEIDLCRAKDIDSTFSINGKSNKLFGYLGNELVSLLYYGNNGNYEDSIWLYHIGVHEKLKFQKQNLIEKIKNIYKYSQKSNGIGTAMIYKLISIEDGKNIYFYSLPEAEDFYKKLGFYKLSLGGLFGSSDNLFQIRQNLELRLKSPGYLKITKDDLARLGIKNLETVL